MCPLRTGFGDASSGAGGAPLLGTAPTPRQEEEAPGKEGVARQLQKVLQKVMERDTKKKLQKVLQKVMERGTRDQGDEDLDRMDSDALRAMQ